MIHERTHAAASPDANPNDVLLFTAASAAIVLSAYAVTLAVARQLSPPHALVAGAANMIPTMLFGAAAYWAVRRFVVGRPLPIQVASHGAIGAGFAIMTYWLLMVMLGAAEGMSAIEFSVRPFSASGTAWQSLQNLTTYGLIAALAYVRSGPAVAVRNVDAERAPGRHPMSLYFIKRDDDLIPMDVEMIVSITGADDYCEVVTQQERHLARLTLAEFEAALDPSRFLRIHRSHIVNVARIVRAEPAGGGRLLLHMANGETIAASRNGSKRLRDRMI
jgi:two-component system, LytTR family, response regulator